MRANAFKEEACETAWSRGGSPPAIGAVKMCSATDAVGGQVRRQTEGDTSDKVGVTRCALSQASKGTNVASSDWSKGAARIGAVRCVNGPAGRRAQGNSSDKGKLGCKLGAVPCESGRRQRQEEFDDYLFDIADWRVQGVDVSELQAYVNEHVMERDKLPP